MTFQYLKIFSFQKDYSVIWHNVFHRRLKLGKKSELSYYLSMLLCYFCNKTCLKSSIVEVTSYESSLSKVGYGSKTDVSKHFYLNILLAIVFF